MRNLYIIISCCFLLLTAFCQSCQQAPFKQGENLYLKYCENCHMEDGSGLGSNIPPLAQADFLKQKQETIGCLIRHGMTEKITVNGKIYEEPMPGVPQLSEFQIANIINYINHAWGNDFGFVKVEELRIQLENCK